MVDDDEVEAVEEVGDASGEAVVGGFCLRKSKLAAHDRLRVCVRVKPAVTLSATNANGSFFFSSFAT